MATEGGSNQSAVCTPKPFLKDGEPIKTGLFNVKRTPHGRYMTISSSEPVKLETSLIEPKTLHTSAGDLMTNNAMDMVPDIVKSSTVDHDRDLIDERAIDPEVLYMPNKVEIPERYMPESDEEEITVEEQMRREEKAEKIKQILTKQTIGSHSISQPDVSKVAGQIHRKVEAQKQETAMLLQLNQQLANQVKNVSRKAAAERRKTWSGSPSKAAMTEDFMDRDDLEVDRTMSSTEYLGPHHKRQENLYI